MSKLRILVNIHGVPKTMCVEIEHFKYIVQVSGSSTDSLVCLVPVQCFFVCFVSQHMALCLFVFAMCSSCPTSLFPLVTPPCLVLVLSSFAWWCSPDPRVLCCFILFSFPLCLCWFFFGILGPVSWSWIHPCASYFDLTQVIFWISYLVILYPHFL